MKKILSVLMLIMFSMGLITVPANAADDNKMVVYTEFRSGNNNHSGDGTKQNPYNLFVDALNAVEENGTIYIGSNGAFVNIIDNYNSPLIIAKNIKIEAEPNLGFRPAISVRTGGIALGADVTFKDVLIGLQNPHYAAIFANGHSLTLNNVGRESGTRVIHVLGGGLFNSLGGAMTPEAGKKAQITIKGSGTKLGNIYAGSMNGSLSCDVDILVEEMINQNTGNIYASGALEGYYNDEGWFDVYTEPTDPAASAEFFPVTGRVNITLNRSTVRIVEGRASGTNRASLSIATDYMYSPQLNGIGKLNITEGTLAPTSLNEDVDVEVSEGAVFNMSQTAKCTVENLIMDNGTLVLDAGGCLKVNGVFSGTGDFKTSGGTPNTSGTAYYEHLYVETTNGDGILTFTPYSTQEMMSLAKTDRGWETSAMPVFDDPVLLSFEMNTTEQIVDQVLPNGLISGSFEVTAEFEEGVVFSDISMVQFTYTVSHNGEIAGPIKSTDIGGGYYEGDILKWNMNIAPADGTITVSNLSTTCGTNDIGFMGDIESGTYDITISAPTLSGSVEKKIRFIVVNPGEELPKDTAVEVNAAGEIDYNNTISVSAAIKADISPSGSAAVYINNKQYGDFVPLENGKVSWDAIPVIFDNNFKIGENTVTVAYTGDDNCMQSSSEAAVTVNKTAVVIKHNAGDMNFDYNGANHELDFGVFGFEDVSGKKIEIDLPPSVSYRNSHGETDEIIMPDTYTSYLTLAEGAFYEAVYQEGPSLTISPAALPIGIHTEESEGIKKVDVKVMYPPSGVTPQGKVKILDKSDGSEVVSSLLAEGAAELLLPELAQGEHTLCAVYEPEKGMPYSVSQSADITVTAAGPEEKENLTVSEEGGVIYVTFNNLTANNLENAVILLALYDKNEVMVSLEAKNVNVAAGEGHTSEFSPTDADYRNIRVFVWNGMEDMTPVCGAVKR